MRDRFSDAAGAWVLPEVGQRRNYSYKPLSLGEAGGRIGHRSS